MTPHFGERRKETGEMTDLSTKGRTTYVTRMIKAPRQAVYAAFLDANALASWLPPKTMTGKVHTLDPRPGGTLRMSLTYDDPRQSPGGKTSEDTDTFEARIVELLPLEKIVWVSEFESQDPSMAGAMTIIWRLADVDGGTEVSVLCEDIPLGVRLEDNEMGCRSSLENLAAFVE